MDRAENSHEVVTVLLVNGAGATATEIRSEYDAAGISHYAYSPSGADQIWPTLRSLISNGNGISEIA